MNYVKSLDKQLGGKAFGQRGRAGSDLDSPAGVRWRNDGKAREIWRPDSNRAAPANPRNSVRSTSSLPLRTRALRQVRCTARREHRGNRSGKDWLTRKTVRTAVECSIPLRR